MKLTTSLAALTFLATSGLTMAQTLAITNATVHTATQQGTLKNATVVIKDGLISAINPANLEADTIVDAKGQSLTPGIILPLSVVGLVEVGAVQSSKDHSDDKADITFDPSIAFNPTSTLIPYTRKGGITSTVITPKFSKNVYRGLNAHMDFSGELEGSEIQTQIGVYAQAGASNKGSRAFKLQTLMDKIADRHQALETAKNKKDDKKEQKPPSKEEKILDDLLAGNKVLTVFANRASDLLHLIKFKQQYQLKMVIAGAADAPAVAKQLAAADVAVVISPLENLPRDFDGRNVSLNDAATLIDAGVKVMFLEYEVHNSYQMRFLAGNAIANGVDPEDALKVLTSNVAGAYGLDGGVIAVGKRADLVLWNGDMFDMQGYVEKMWIDGKAYSTQSRHDKLRERYRHKNDMPAAYSK